MVVDANGDSVRLKSISLATPTRLADVPSEYLEPADYDQLMRAVGGSLVSYAEENLPPVVYWRYDESDLLPPRVDAREFAADPGTCVPLQRLFELAEVDDIETTVVGALDGRTQAFRNLLNRVSQRATKHFQGIWKDYKSVSFELCPNGEQIESTIRDVHNHFEFSQRSDGFKRFVSFLLSISADARVERLNNAVILIDEPEIGLHPSGGSCLFCEIGAA